MCGSHDFSPPLWVDKLRVSWYAQKRLVSVTLDIECYDDLELEDLDWREMLDLQGNENVHVTIKELADIF